jgi:hypothetical protein
MYVLKSDAKFDGLGPSEGLLHQALTLPLQTNVVRWWTGPFTNE